MKKYLDYITLLCERAGVSVDDCFSGKGDFFEGNLLCHVVKVSNQDIIKLLLEYKLSPNSKNKFGETPMHRCSISNNVEVAQLLFDRGALLMEGDEFGITPLHVASYCYSKEMVKFLLENGANPNSLDFTSSSALHKICSNEGDFGSEIELGDLFLDICIILCGYGADINSQDCNGNTPLHNFLIVNASKFSNESIKLLKRLLSIPGIDLSIKNSKGEDVFSITDSLVQVSEFKAIVLDLFNNYHSNVKPAFLNNPSIFYFGNNEESIMHF